MGVPRATTPTFEFMFTDEQLDLTEASHVYLTFEQGNKTLTKQDDALVIEPKKITVSLTQEESLGFKGLVNVQANWTNNIGQRVASNIINVQFTAQLLRKVVE